MEHVEFLDVSGNDPRRACAEGLVEHIGSDGILMAYNAGFEKRVVRELAAMYPDLSKSLLESTTQDTNELRWWLLGFGD